MAVKPIPDGFHAVTPYLIIEGTDKAIEFMKKAFNAREVERMQQPDGKIAHAEMRIGDSIIMMGESKDDFKPMPSSLYVYVDNVDEVYRKGIDAGGTSVMEPADQFYGDRNAGVKDPSGNIWWIAKHIEDVPKEELVQRAQAQKL